MDKTNTGLISRLGDVAKEMQKLTQEQNSIVTALRKNGVNQSSTNTTTSTQQRGRSRTTTSATRKTNSTPNGRSRAVFEVKDTRGNILTTDGPVAMRYVIRTILTTEASKFTLQQLQDRYSKNDIKHSVYGVILDRKTFNALPDSMRDLRYSQSEVKAKDNQPFYILKAWSLYQNIATKEKGNFSYLLKLLKNYGYQVSKS